MSIPQIPHDVATLRTGSLPDAQVVKAIKATINEKNTSISAIELELADLRRKIEELESKRNSLQETVLLHESFVAPIRRLLPEILLEIFELCLEGGLSFNDKKAPLLLAHVCHTWRELILASPPLWSQISIGSSPNKNALSLWIKNSASHALDLEVRMDGMPEDLKPLQDLILNNLARCRSFILRAPYEAMTQLLPTDLSSLQIAKTITIACNERPPATTENAPNISWQCPRLESLCYMNCGRLLNLVMPPSTLKSLQFQFDSYNPPDDTAPRVALLKLIRDCTMLEDLDLELAYFTPETPETAELWAGLPEWYRLKRLKLTLEKNCSSEVLQFPRHIRAPNLEYLQVDGKRWGHGDGITDMLRILIRQCQPSLRRLSLKFLATTSENAAPVLSLATEVERLKISSFGFLSCLIPRRGQPSSEWMCPKVHRITLLSDCGATPDFITLIERRTRPEFARILGPPNETVYLKRIDVKVRDAELWRREPAVLEQIKQFRRAREEMTIIGLEGVLDGN